MATRLEDAKIKVQLDVDSAKAELTRIEDQVKDLNDARRRVDDRRKQDEAQDKRDMQARKREAETKTSRFGQTREVIQSVVDKVIAPIQATGAAAERGLPLLGVAAREILGDTVGTKVQEQLNKLSDRITTIRADIDSIRPTIQKAVEMNTATLRLGGRLPENETELIKQIYEIESKQQSLTRNFRKDVESETIRLLLGGVKTALNK